MPPQGTAIDNLVNKEDIEDYFDNLAVDTTILDDDKAVIVRKKEITWKALERLQAVHQGEAQSMCADPPRGRRNVGN